MKNFNSQNLADVRIEGLWQPSTPFKVNATQVIHRNAYGTSEGEYAVGVYPHSTRAPYPLVEKITTCPI